MTLSFLTSIVVLAIAASLESHWLATGFPSNAARDRERLLLTAGIWGTLVSRTCTLSLSVARGAVICESSDELTSLLLPPPLFPRLLPASSLLADRHPPQASVGRVRHHVPPRRLRHRLCELPKPFSSSLETIALTLFRLARSSCTCAARRP